MEDWAPHVGRSVLSDVDEQGPTFGGPAGDVAAGRTGSVPVGKAREDTPVVTTILSLGASDENRWNAPPYAALRPKMTALPS